MFEHLVVDKREHLGRVAHAHPHHRVVGRLVGQRDLHVHEFEEGWPRAALRLDLVGRASEALGGVAVYSNSTYGEPISTAMPATMRGCVAPPTSATSTKQGTISGRLGIGRAEAKVGLPARSRARSCRATWRLPAAAAAALEICLEVGSLASSCAWFCFCRSFLASCSGRSSTTRIVPTAGGFSTLAGSVRERDAGTLGENSSTHSGLAAQPMPVRT